MRAGESVRDKLIELVGAARFAATGNQLSEQQKNEFIADYLIEQGVMVFPVPLNSTVYALYYCRECRRSKGKVKTLHSRIVTNSTLKMAMKYGAVEIREKACSKQDMLLLDRLVFKTREEAETAIAQKGGQVTGAYEVQKLGNRRAEK